MNRENLKSVVLWWLGTFIVLILIVFNTIFYQLLKYSFYNEIKTSLILVTNDIKTNLKLSSSKTFLIPPKINYPISPVIIKVVSNDKRVIAKSFIDLLDVNLVDYIGINSDFFIIKSKNYGKVAVDITKIESPLKGYIIVATPLYKIDLKLQDILVKMAILNPLLLVLLLIGANLIIDRILNPIKNITKAANEISVGDLDRIIPIPLQNDEIKDLVMAFNSMVIRLRNGIDMINRFNSDVSHELRTPLTVLKGEIELALRKERDISYYKDVLNRALKEINYMIDLVEEMLIFSKLDNEVEKTQNLNLDEILLQVVNKLSIKAKNKNIKINLDIEAIEITNNPFVINVIFVNIIDNAIKYSNKGSVINISLYKKSDIIFEVKDNGIGINKQDLENIMNRFYRSDESRNRNIKGFGLGLSIVKKALDTIGGSIEIDSEINKGTTVTIKIKDKNERIY